MAKPARNGRGLTAKQEKAVQHYILHGNMTAAYRHAYDCGRMKAATIKRRAFELFNTPHIAAR
ncbi:MAG: terminase small subunit, partial [Candidatus Brocadiia bacterium]